MSERKVKLVDLGSLVGSLAELHGRPPGDRSTTAALESVWADWQRFFDAVGDQGRWSVPVGRDEGRRAHICAPLIADGLMRLRTTSTSVSVGLVVAEWADPVQVAGARAPVKLVTEHWLLFDAAAAPTFQFQGADGNVYTYPVTAGVYPSRLPWPRMDAPGTDSLDVHYDVVAGGEQIRPAAFLAGVKAAYQSAPFACRYVKATVAVYDVFPEGPDQGEQMPDDINGRTWEEWVAWTSQATAKQRTWIYGEFERPPEQGSAYTKAGRLHLAWRADLGKGIPDPNGGQGFSRVRTAVVRRELDGWFVAMPGTLGASDAGAFVVYALADLELYSGAELSALLA